ncbi:unnamed protein product [Miscanthus lutarioriparius]|uniref:Uncharacterized protein n=1 Tax=Miscanthus lutarioriparius TaxID=422564 RepID=A0A811QH75_9POAL|nr:unnamed protein product [Miscanthus lutarioriparius]
MTEDEDEGRTAHGIYDGRGQVGQENSTMMDTFFMYDQSFLEQNTVEQRLASLEASYVDRDADYSQRISELEAIRVTQIKDERDARVAALESTAADLAAWRPGVEGLLDDVRLQVQKLGVKCDRAVFDTMSHQPGIIPSPTLAVMHSSARLTADRPHGHRVNTTTRDVASGVVTTWTHVRPRLAPTTTASTPPADAKLASIKSYRRALGLCYKCNAKWSKDHQCAPEVLHAVHDLWEFCFDDDDEPTEDSDKPVPTEQLCLAFSKAAVTGVPASRTIRLLGS